MLIIKKKSFFTQCIQHFYCLLTSGEGKGYEEFCINKTGDKYYYHLFTSKRNKYPFEPVFTNNALYLHITEEQECQTLG